MTTHREADSAKRVSLHRAILVALLVCQAGWAWQAPLSIPLDGPWDLVHVTGKTDGSAFAAKGAPNPALEVSYVFANTDPNSSEAPDEKGRDRFQLVQKGEWDLGGFSWGDITLTGDGSPFAVALDLTDAAGRSATYRFFPLAVAEERTYAFTLAGPGSITPGFDPATVRQIALVADEGGEKRYTANRGRFTVTGITFSNQDREKQIAANLRYAQELVGREGEFADRLKSLSAALESRSGLIDGIEGESAELKLLALFSGPRAGQPFAVCALSPMEKARPSLLHFDGRPAASVSLEAAANEYESAQLVVVPQASGVKGISASVLGDLVGPDGNRIGAAHIEIRRAGFVNTTPTCFTFVGYVGEVEDPLMPNGLMDIPGDRVQPVWVTVHVPDGTQAGLYHTRVRFSGAGHVREIPVSVRVLGFSLPKTSAVSRHVYYWLPAVANWYGFRQGRDSCDYHRDGFGIPLDLIRKHLEFLLSYRLAVINITWPFNADDGSPSWPLTVRADGTLDFTLHDELLQFCRERGMREFSVGDFGRSKRRIYDPAYRERVERVLRPYLAHVRERGWAKDGVFKVYDEPAEPAEYEQMLEECRFVRSLEPSVKTLAAIAHPEPGTQGLLDVFLFRPNNWSAGVAAAVRAQGGTPSWYWCSVPYFKPFPNYFINYPATDPRLIEWLHFRYDCTYFLMWGVNVWQNNFRPAGEPRWPDVPWNPNTYASFNGDGHFVYPWPDGSLVSSVRLESLRDGAEDVEYFTLLRDAAAELERNGKRPDLVAEVKALLTLDPVVQSVTSYHADPAAIEAIRRRAAKLLEQVHNAEPPDAGTAVPGPSRTSFEDPFDRDDSGHYDLQGGTWTYDPERRCLAMAKARDTDNETLWALRRDVTLPRAFTFEAEYTADGKDTSAGLALRNPDTGDYAFASLSLKKAVEGGWWVTAWIVYSYPDEKWGYLQASKRYIANLADPVFTLRLTRLPGSNALEFLVRNSEAGTLETSLSPDTRGEDGRKLSPAWTGTLDALSRASLSGYDSRGSWRRIRLTDLTR